MAVVSYRNSTSNHNTLFRTAATLLVVSYRNSTSNHNKSSPYVNKPELYLIEILHQTTTRTAAALISIGCILSKFYIKPQLRIAYPVEAVGCILSKFYIKPQLSASHCLQVWGCILSKFYIKPQLKLPAIHNAGVVSYRNSTSNHNNVSGGTERTWVVSYRNSTSNHNCCMN